MAHPSLVVMTLYQTLEVEPHASQREIKRAYRRLARRYHPDLNPDDPDKEEQFKEVVAAYEVLSDRKKRADYDARTRDPVSPREDVEWRRPDRSTQEWKDLERDLRRWRRGPPFDARDAHLGALLAVALTLASQASRDVEPFVHVLVTALAAGVVAAAPFRLVMALAGEPVRSGAALLAPLAAAYAAMLGGALVTGVPPSLTGASGIPFAFVGGMMGALGGGMLGRTFRQASEPVVGVLVGGVTGAALGGIVGGFFWYWSSVLRWMDWPARDDLSVLASAGVVGALLGAALAAALGGARDPA